MSDLTIVLDQREDWLNANDRSHWARKARITRYWRDLTATKARQAGASDMGRVHVTATFHKPTSRRYDPANLYPTVKACVDGLVDAGVVRDDDHRHVVGPDMRAGEPGPRRITLTIRSLDEEQP